MTQLRTDLALEAHELSRGRAAELPGAATRTRERNGIPVTEVAVTTQEAARALGKPVGVYVTLDLGARPAAEAAEPDVIVAVDALAARALARVCTTVQLTDAGVVPGSGVGNRRAALNRETLGVPVIAVGAPTVVDAATLARDVLAEAGAPTVESAALRGSAGVFVTTRDVDAQVRALAGIVAMGVNLALHPLDYDDLRALTEG